MKKKKKKKSKLKNQMTQKLRLMRRNLPVFSMKLFELGFVLKPILERDEETGGKETRPET